MKSKFLIVCINDRMIMPRVLGTATTETEALTKLVDVSVMSLGSECAVYELKRFTKRR